MPWVLRLYPPTVILDVYSRKAVGHAISKRIELKLTLVALNMALMRRKPPRGVIHHVDRGVQYLSGDYVEGSQNKRL